MATGSPPLMSSPRPTRAHPESPEGPVLETPLGSHHCVNSQKEENTNQNRI
ncbi:hypothetical protein PGTUg99_004976 [Puccinia graminis f. sp. tritici]|uniref:Uncharacterized protein n=1 Tax=Puccinia graminis f. sp. tritici TaxID=56615 RepID=A0A5B0SAZ5_PUCGR|nr:hypothetical protein PGTUg99_004976 [Puccinia graminis f. sp. tritici]